MLATASHQAFKIQRLLLEILILIGEREKKGIQYLLQSLMKSDKKRPQMHYSCIWKFKSIAPKIEISQFGILLFIDSNSKAQNLCPERIKHPHLFTTFCYNILYNKIEKKTYYHQRICFSQIFKKHNSSVYSKRRKKYLHLFDVAKLLIFSRFYRSL